VKIVSVALKASPRSQCIAAAKTIRGMRIFGGSWRKYDCSKGAPETIVARGFRRFSSNFLHSFSMDINVILYMRRRYSKEKRNCAPLEIAKARSSLRMLLGARVEIAALEEKPIRSQWSAYNSSKETCLPMFPMILSVFRPCSPHKSRQWNCRVGLRYSRCCMLVLTLP
jgi:hypothetical protein